MPLSHAMSASATKAPQFEKRYPPLLLSPGDSENDILRFCLHQHLCRSYHEYRAFQVRFPNTLKKFNYLAFSLLISQNLSSCGESVRSFFFYSNEALITFRLTILSLPRIFHEFDNVTGNVLVVLTNCCTLLSYVTQFFYLRTLPSRRCKCHRSLYLGQSYSCLVFILIISAKAA